MKNTLIICILTITLKAYAQNSLPYNPGTSLALVENPVKKEKNILSKPKGLTVREVKWSALENLLNSNTDTTYIVNFWATWCGPCVKELPYFEQLNRSFAGQKVKIVLVSMDFVQDKDKRVVPFVERMQLKNTVWLLNEPDANSWIDRVDPSWSGALPATLILNPTNKKRAFYEKSLNYETLAHALGYFVGY
ncbi:redoxin domain-containing protein [Cytophagaceae bacterium SJW1-29]|uniref:Redoxin domain-containing protein n=1 Tax=Salmonirosea aquatica TaxID=2654236 RepID=A0A7C9F303_9BACT|nr:redoxin domain-containing protein [Cytophagaceae bacterium SJW1-29]